MIRKWVKKVFRFSETGHVDGLEAKIRKLEKKLSDTEGQIKVDNVEMTSIKAKLFKIRQILGRDDNTFSRFTRKQIDEMSIGEFTSVEAEIDQDVLDGKLFLS